MAALVAVCPQFGLDALRGTLIPKNINIKTQRVTNESIAETWFFVTWDHVLLALYATNIEIVKE